MNSRAQLSPQIKKTNQNHSTTIKRIKKKGKNNASQKSCLLLHVFAIAIEGPARGYPLRTCFLHLFNRIVIKKTAVLNQVIFWILERFALFLFLNSFKYN